MNTENEVQAALDNERRAFARKQDAFFTLLPSQSLPGDSPSAAQGTHTAEKEALEAEADWKAKDAEFRRIVDESLTGSHH